MVRILKNLIFPFSAIVGQENVKKSLILNAINPSIGGVLIKGDKGTGKTTAVRALADLLPPIKVVKECPFNCDPDDKDSLCESCKSGDYEVEEKKMRVVELPLGATEDRVVGSINLEKALREGIKALEPGILAEANRNILYVDEINLLDDNLVDVLLDAAAYGVNVVEREGVSLAHPSNFILVGTMNPAEGELRLQLSDRIGLHISVQSLLDLEDRVQIMDRREEFERDPTAFRELYKDSQEYIQASIIQARHNLNKVRVPRIIMELIARISLDMGVDGHRADIAILKTAKTIAAYRGQEQVNYHHVEEAALLVLGERVHKQSCDQEQIRRKVEDAQSQMQDEREKEEEEQSSEEESTGQSQSQGANVSSEESEGKAKGMQLKSNEEMEETPEKDEEGVDIKKLLKMKGKKKKRLYGRSVDSKTEKGRYIKSRLPSGESRDVAIDATIRAAALHSEGSIKVRSDDIRHKVRKHGARASIAVVVDISGSMVSDRKANRVKSILDSIIQDTNRHQDKISVIGFKGKEAEVIVPTTKRASSFQDQIDQITVGGTTPLASGMKKGLEILRKENKKGEFVPFMVILTDGMPNVGIEEGPIPDALKIAEKLQEYEILTIVINFEQTARYGRDMNMELAIASGGRYYDVQELENPGAAVNKILDFERNNLWPQA
jgi:magnesium chelatase subunit D